MRAEAVREIDGKGDRFKLYNVFIICDATEEKSEKDKSAEIASPPLLLRPHSPLYRCINFQLLQRLSERLSDSRSFRHIFRSIFHEKMTSLSFSAGPNWYYAACLSIGWRPPQQIRKHCSRRSLAAAIISPRDAYVLPYVCQFGINYARLLMRLSQMRNALASSSNPSPNWTEAKTKV